MKTVKQILHRFLPSDVFAKKYPVSVKGIVYIGDKIVLLKNERDEWELPGGKIEPGETPGHCTVREIREELNLDVTIHSLVDVWMYNIHDRINVLIITYLCNTAPPGTEIKISSEHKEAGLFSLAEIGGLNMPQGYKNSILKAANL